LAHFELIVVVEASLKKDIRKITVALITKLAEETKDFFDVFAESSTVAIGGVCCVRSLPNEPKMSSRVGVLLVVRRAKSISEEKQ
jgi:hypothetical protein